MGLQGSADSKYDLRGKVSKLHELRGYSAYEIAVIHGFNGTEEEWATELRRQVDEAKGYAVQAEEALDDLVKVKSATDIVAEGNLYFSDNALFGFKSANSPMLTSIPEDGETVIVRFDDEKYAFTKKTYEMNELNVYHYVGNLYLWLKGRPELNTGENVLVVFADDGSALIITTKEGDTHKCHVYKAEYKINEEYLENTELAAKVANLEKGEGMEELLAEVNGRVASIEEWIADKEYVNISVSASHDKTAVVEKGTVFNEVTVSWSVTRVPTALTISGNNITGTESLPLAKSGSKTITGLNINADNASTFAWTVKATGEKTTDVATAKASGFNFRTRVYYGAADLPATINSDFVKSLPKNSGLVSSKVKSIEVNGGGKYIWYCLPVGGSGMGKCSFMSNNFPFDMQEPQTVSVTNDKGYTENYYVYRSTNQIDVTMKIEVS